MGDTARWRPNADVRLVFEDSGAGNPRSEQAMTDGWTSGTGSGSGSPARAAWSMNSNCNPPSVLEPG